MNTKLTFSGHDSFVCKQYWLKKGIDFLSEGNKFSDETAVVELGVGKNMVGAIRYWLRSFDLIDLNDQPNEIAKYLFGKKGKDSFLEDFSSLWLLHYLLVKTNRASIFNLFFNQFRKERPEFSKEQLHRFLIAQADSISPNTIEKDSNVFLRTYIKPKYDSQEIEENFSAILIDLDLVKPIKFKSKESSQWYQVTVEERSELPNSIFLFSILDNEGYADSVSFRELETGINSPGSVFAMNREGLYDKLKELEETYSGITFSETAGNLELQFKKKPTKWEILDEHYS